MSIYLLPSTHIGGKDKTKTKGRFSVLYFKDLIDRKSS